MESRLTVAGHPVHLILMIFPLGLFTTALVFDAGNLLGGPALLGEVAYWTIGAAIVGGLLAAVAGVVDVMFIRDNHRKRVGVLRSLVDFGVLLVFLVIMLVRVGSTERAAGGGLLAVEILAFAVAVATAWRGGEIANRLATAALVRSVAGPRM